MHICYVTQTGFDEPGAENTHSTEVIRHLVQAGIHVTVVHPSRAASVRALGADERRLFVRFAPLRRIWFQISLLLLSWRSPLQFDAMYVRQAALMIVPALLKRRLGIPIVGEFNTCFAALEKAGRIPFLLYLLATIERRALREYDRIIVISSSLKKQIVDKHGIRPERIEVIHNGANVDIMRPLSKSECRAALRLPPDAFVVAFVGQLHTWQGIDQLIEAVAMLRRRPCRDIHLVIAGSLKHRFTYEATAVSLGIRDHVHFLGPVAYESVPQVISAADVAAAPGDPTESMNYRVRSPLKVYEYLACGRPVVAGDLETLRELFSRQSVGFLVKPGSVPHLVEAIDELLKNPGLVASMGRNARRVAEQSLSWTSVVQRLLPVLKSVVEQCGVRNETLEKPL
jgi:glycosyltransferase involved in cell wall biosynthesis